LRVSDRVCAAPRAGHERGFHLPCRDKKQRVVSDGRPERRHTSPSRGNACRQRVSAWSRPSLSHSGSADSVRAGTGGPGSAGQPYRCVILAAPSASRSTDIVPGSRWLCPGVQCTYYTGALRRVRPRSCIPRGRPSAARPARGWAGYHLRRVWAGRPVPQLVNRAAGELTLSSR
jgi:hypothetical protein